MTQIHYNLLFNNIVAGTSLRTLLASNTSTVAKGFGIESLTEEKANNLAAGFTFKQGGHVRVDIFYQRFGARGQALVNLFGSLFLLLPVTGFIFWISWEYVAASWAVWEGSREAGGLPGVFLLKTLLPLMAINLLLQGLAETLRSALVLVEEPA